MDTDRDAILTNLRSVAIGCKEGIPLHQLQRDYRDIIGSPIPYVELGYRSLEAFLGDIPEAISLERRNGQLVAAAVANASTQHIASLVSRQKSERKKPTKFFPGRPPPHRRVGYRGRNYQPPNVRNNRYEREQPSRSYHPLNREQGAASMGGSARHPYEPPPRFLRQNEQRTQQPHPRRAPQQPPSRSPTPPLASNVVVREDDQGMIHVAVTTVPASAKEFVHEYAKKSNLPAPNYQTSRTGQRDLNYLSKLLLGGKLYYSYPDSSHTAEEAEEKVAAKAMHDIQEKREHKVMYPETPTNNADQIKILVDRIEEIVCEKPTGMYTNGISREYENAFRELLPDNWLDLLQQNSALEVEAPFGTRVPKGAYIVRPHKGSSSGDATPSSTSSSQADLGDIGAVQDGMRNLLVGGSRRLPTLPLPEGNQWSVHVTSIVTPCTIAARLYDQNDEMLQLSQDMNEFYSGNALPAPDVFVGGTYAAWQSDAGGDSWHRVVVQEIAENDQVYCCFVDFGDIDYVNITNLQMLDERFQNIPHQALYFVLPNLEEHVRYIRMEYLEEHLPGKTLIAEILKKVDTHYAVNLYDTSGKDDINLNQMLLELCIKEALDWKIPKPRVLSVAYLTHISDEGIIFLRFELNSFIEVEMAKLAPTFLEVATSKRKPIPRDTLCAVLFRDNWYRATVNKYTTEYEVEVTFIDYGNTAALPTSQICELEPASRFLAEIPSQVLRFGLFEVPPSADLRWSEAAAQRVDELVPPSREVMLRVMCEADLPEVNLCIRNEELCIININDTLACSPELFRRSEDSGRRSPGLAEAEPPRNNHCQSGSSESGGSNPEEAPLPRRRNQVFDVFVPLAASPDNFVVQPHASSGQLSSMQQQMQQFYSNEENLCDVQPDLVQEGDSCAALNPLDGTWYRARLERIVHSDPPMVVVHFVDYGDFTRLSLSRVQPLWQKFKRLPCQAIKASLAGVRPAGGAADWDALHCVEFRRLIENRSFASLVADARTDDPDEPRLQLVLIDVRGREDLYIHDVLVERGLADQRPLPRDLLSTLVQGPPS